MSGGLDRYTVALLHLDKDFNDECGNIWTPTGTAAISNANISSFSKGQLWVNGSSYISTNFTTGGSLDLTLGDFTIDWREYRFSGSSNVNTGIAVSVGSGGDHQGMTLSHAYQGKLYGNVTKDNVNWTVNGMLYGDLNLNSLRHKALVRAGDYLKTFDNGNMLGNYYFPASTPIKFATNKIILGAWLLNSTTYFQGYFKEFRISKIARWTNSFIPSSVPYFKQYYLTEDKDNYLYGYK